MVEYSSPRGRANKGKRVSRAQAISSRIPLGGCRSCANWTGNQPPGMRWTRNGPGDGSERSAASIWRAASDGASKAAWGHGPDEPGVGHGEVGRQEQHRQHGGYARTARNPVRQGQDRREDDRSVGQGPLSLGPAPAMSAGPNIGSGAMRPSGRQRPAASRQAPDQPHQARHQSGQRRAASADASGPPPGVTRSQPTPRQDRQSHGHESQELAGIAERAEAGQEHREQPVGAAGPVGEKVIRPRLAQQRVMRSRVPRRTGPHRAHQSGPPYLPRLATRPTSATVVSQMRQGGPSRKPPALRARTSARPPM